MAKSLMTSLAERGHQVDVITHFPMKKPIPNYTDISVAGSVQTAVNNMFAENVTKFNANNMRLLVQAAGTNTCKLLGLPKIQQLIKNPPKDPPYDVVIVEVRKLFGGTTNWGPRSKRGAFLLRKSVIFYIYMYYMAELKNYQKLNHTTLAAKSSIIFY